MSAPHSPPADRGAPSSPAEKATRKTRADNALRILVLAPTSNDARLSADLLEKAGLPALVRADIAELCTSMSAGCGALLLAEEALATAALPSLIAQLEAQPSWSDLPIVLVAAAGAARTHWHRLGSLGPIGNISIVERPVRPETLVTAFKFALRSRRRQYQVRALLEERTEMTRLAQQQARIFDTTLSSIPDFTYIFDPEGRFVYANKSLLDLLGLPLVGVVGKSFHELPYPAELADTLARQIQHVFATGEVLRDETPYTNPAGLTGFYEYIFSPVFGPDGTVEVVAGSTRDTSARRLTEEALRDTDRKKDEFLAMLAHELRNPLASVANAVEVLKTLDEPETRRWSLSVLDRQTRQLAHLIDDLLDVSRITKGKIRLRKETIDAGIILDRARESVRPLIAERQHEFISRYRSRTLWIEADPTRIEQIVVNLLTNAAKYTPAGGKVELSALREGDEILITVRDSGIGIAPQRLPEMFQLFAQGERSIARSEGGLGIGLTIVQRLAELHGGRVDAHSAGPNQGSTFTLRLPATPPPAAAQEAAAPLDQMPAGLRVLIVDDNLDTAEGLERLLRIGGHDTALAHDGAEALRQARAQVPDVVILDIGLPGMDGFEVVQHLRAEPQCRHALMIAITGYGRDEDRQRAHAAGFDHHLVKPIEFATLKKLLAAVVPRAGGG